MWVQTIWDTPDIVHTQIFRGNPNAWGDQHETIPGIVKLKEIVHCRSELSLTVIFPQDPHNKLEGILAKSIPAVLLFSLCLRPRFYSNCLSPKQQSTSLTLVRLPGSFFPFLCPWVEHLVSIWKSSFRLPLKLEEPVGVRRDDICGTSSSTLLGRRKNVVNFA